MILIKGDGKGRVCRKNKLGVTLSPVPMMVRQEMREGVKRKYQASLYASDVDRSRYGSLVYSHFLEIGWGIGERGG
jgi:hypothetical protein